MATLEAALGLCRRAGKLTMGTPLVLEAVKKGKAALVLLASDVSEQTAEKITVLCGHKSVPCRKIGLNKGELSRAVGLERETGAVAVPKEFLALVEAATSEVKNEE